MKARTADTLHNRFFRYQMNLDKVVNQNGWMLHLHIIVVIYPPETFFK